MVANRLYPEIKSIAYNPEKDTFEGVESGRLSNDKDGGGNRKFARSDFQRFARIARTMPDKGGGVFASSTGSTSIERAILTHTFLQAKSRESRELLLARFSNVGS